MPLDRFTAQVLAQEGRGLLSRLDHLRPLSLREAMVPAALLSPHAYVAIERFLASGRKRLREAILDYLRWLETPAARAESPERANRRLTWLRLRFGAVLTHLDIFAEALGQRSEVDTGVMLGGLDIAAHDAMALPGHLVPPPIVCYLARDPGGAIRRTRTRLPGGGINPVAMIRLPRERMVGSGIASSLVHEAGHEAAARLSLVPSLQRSFDGAADLAAPWPLWLSEIAADVWAIGKVGVASTWGLISLVSLPSRFVFRESEGDPHPTPWLRVLLSCGVGRALYPDPQWERLARLWESLYPLHGLPEPRRAQLAKQRAEIPRVVERILASTPAGLGGQPLGPTLRRAGFSPGRLRRERAAWKECRDHLRTLTPALAFAALGQARADASISPEEESATLSDLLKHWALRGALRRAEACVASIDRAQHRIN